MKDIELLDIIFNDLYLNNSCKDLSKVILEKTGIEITSEKCFQIFNLILSTGFVKELHWSVGPHREIMLNAEGNQMMLLHGSYSAYIDSKKLEKEKVTEEKKLEKKIWNWKLRKK